MKQGAVSYRAAFAIELREELSYIDYMLRKLLLRFLVVVSLCVGVPVIAGAEGNASGQVAWMHADFPPLRIINGPYAGQGPSDMIHELMRRELSELDHTVITANLSRTLNWMEQGRQVLAVGLIPTPEREKIMRFSLPCVLVPPVCLVVRADEKQTLASGQRILLRDFVATHRLGVAVNRSYGPEVDAVLRKDPVSANIITNPGSTLFDSLLEMLLLDRVDGVLAYPFEAVYVARMKGKENGIRLVPLHESLIPITGRIAAPRTPWGEAMIERVDDVLLRHRTTPEYRQAFERWLTPEAIPGYRAMYDVFLKSH